MTPEAYEEGWVGDDAPDDARLRCSSGCCGARQRDVNHEVDEAWRKLYLECWERGWELSRTMNTPHKVHLNIAHELRNQLRVFMERTDDAEKALKKAGFTYDQWRPERWMPPEGEKGEE